MKLYTPEEAKMLVGQELGTSDWLLVDQQRINAFAEVTEDHQFIHVDPEAAAKTPFGGTIAHGFLTLSLLTRLFPEEAVVLQGITMGVNYGFERVRFLAPVPVNSRIRARHKLLDIADKGGGRWLVTTEVTIEIEGEQRPALVAEWLGLQYC
ncbi:MaoC family dehydratase [Sphingomonas arenae]|uniref:MaoC family dehydratase n=1 Tax=Sphingomonas arenae TaxID=2812555 RepID=UPI001967A8A7|nr:MaoC family dehydratase [Sphingomonas arenae]